MFSLMYKAVINNKPNVDYQLLTNVIPLGFLVSLPQKDQTVSKETNGTKK